MESSCPQLPYWRFGLDMKSKIKIATEAESSASGRTRKFAKAQCTTVVALKASRWFSDPCWRIKGIVRLSISLEVPLRNGQSLHYLSIFIGEEMYTHRGNSACAAL